MDSRRVFWHLKDFEKFPNSHHKRGQNTLATKKGSISPFLLSSRKSHKKILSPSAFCSIELTVINLHPLLKRVPKELWILLVESTKLWVSRPFSDQFLRHLGSKTFELRPNDERFLDFSVWPRAAWFFLFLSTSCAEANLCCQFRQIRSNHCFDGKLSALPPAEPITIIQ